MLVTDLIKHIERDEKYSVWRPTTPSGWMMILIEDGDYDGLEVDWISISTSKETLGEIQINTKWRD